MATYAIGSLEGHVSPSGAAVISFGFRYNGDIFASVGDVKPGYTFQKWTFNSGGATGFPTESADEDWEFPNHDDETSYNGILTAVFSYTGGGEDPSDYVAIQVNAGEGGTVTGGGIYRIGTNYTISATADRPTEGQKYKFKKWECSDGTEPTDNPLTRTASVDLTYTANFVKVFDVGLVHGLPFRINGSFVFEGDATINCTVEGLGEYEDGEECTITVNPTDGAELIGYEVHESKDGSDSAREVDDSGNQAIELTVDGDKYLEILCMFRRMNVTLKKKTYYDRRYPTQPIIEDKDDVGTVTGDVTNLIYAGDSETFKIESVVNGYKIGLGTVRSILDVYFECEYSEYPRLVVGYGRPIEKWPFYITDFAGYVMNTFSSNPSTLTLKETNPFKSGNQGWDVTINWFKEINMPDGLFIVNSCSVIAWFLKYQSWEIDVAGADTETEIYRPYPSSPWDGSTSPEIPATDTGTVEIRCRPGKAIKKITISSDDIDCSPSGVVLESDDTSKRSYSVAITASNFSEEQLLDVDTVDVDVEIVDIVGNILYTPNGGGLILHGTNGAPMYDS